MLRILGDRSSLLAALTAHWAEQQNHAPFRRMFQAAPQTLEMEPRPVLQATLALQVLPVTSANGVELEHPLSLKRLSDDIAIKSISSGE
jgi:hypothetical protein